MVTAAVTKSQMLLEEWQESPLSEDWSVVRRAIDPRAWQGHARRMAFTNPRPAPPALYSQSTFDRVAVDASGLTVAASTFDRVAVDASGLTVAASTFDRVAVDASGLTVAASTFDRVAVDASGVVASGEWDWEDGGSYSRRTIERVRDLLESLAFIARDTFGYHLAVPHPAPADEGSIDVFFEGAERNLLINTPQGDELVTYFGSDRSGTTVGGSLSRSKDHRDLMALAAWILGIR